MKDKKFNLTFHAEGKLRTQIQSPEIELVPFRGPSRIRSTCLCHTADRSCRSNPAENES